MNSSKMVFALLSVASLLMGTDSYNCSNAQFAQCHGLGWQGETCCRSGYACTGSSVFAQCNEVYEEKPSTCVPTFEKCGGNESYTGPTNCCQEDFTCQMINEELSQCFPTFDEELSLLALTTTAMPMFDCPNAEYEQCDGSAFTGTECCRNGYECVRSDASYSQCRPTLGDGTCVESFAQCGGLNFVPETAGVECCQEDYSCEIVNEFYWQCLRQIDSVLNSTADTTEAPTSSLVATDSPSTTMLLETTTTPSTSTIMESSYEPTFISTSAFSSSIPSDTSTSTTMDPSIQPTEFSCINAAYEQCDGVQFEGEKCCRDGYECEASDEYYSQCRPAFQSSCVYSYGRCGGVGFAEASMDCCQEDFSCEFVNEFYSQCQPSIGL